jgi:hypothetical protein
MAKHPQVKDVSGQATLSRLLPGLREMGACVATVRSVPLRTATDTFLVVSTLTGRLGQVAGKVSRKVFLGGAGVRLP